MYPCDLNSNQKQPTYEATIPPSTVQPPPGFNFVWNSTYAPTRNCKPAHATETRMHSCTPASPKLHRAPDGYYQCTPGQFAFAAHQLLQKVDIDMDNIKEWAIMDSGATSHFLVTDVHVANVSPAIKPLNVQIPNGEMVSTTHTCELDLPKLPPAARQGHILPGIASHSLHSEVRLCNAGCKVSFTMIECIVEYRERIVLKGRKCTRTGLWTVPLKDRP